MMYDRVYTARFKRDLRLAQKRGRDLSSLYGVATCLSFRRFIILGLSKLEWELQVPL
jgi:hypothetical protein